MRRVCLQAQGVVDVRSFVRLLLDPTMFGDADGQVRHGPLAAPTRTALFLVPPSPPPSLPAPPLPFTPLASAHSCGAAPVHVALALGAVGSNSDVGSRAQWLPFSLTPGGPMRCSLAMRLVFCSTFSAPHLPSVPPSPSTPPSSLPIGHLSSTGEDFASGVTIDGRLGGNRARGGGRYVMGGEEEQGEKGWGAWRKEGRQVWGGRK